MAVAVSFNPSNPKLYQTTTASVTGGAATTAYFLSILDPSGHTKMLNFKTDGSGNASVPIVTSLSGTHTVNVFLQVPAAVATNTFGTSGHS